MIRHASGHLQVIQGNSIQEPGAFTIEGKVDPIAEIEQTHHRSETLQESSTADRPKVLTTSATEQSGHWSFASP